MTHTMYPIDVYRDGRFWMIRIPDLDRKHGLVGEALTQARRLSDVESEARDYIVVMADVSPGDVGVVTRSVTVDELDVRAVADDIADRRATADELTRAASKDAAHLAGTLADGAVPVRDIGSLLGVSYQRAHQLVAER